MSSNFTRCSYWNHFHCSMSPVARQHELSLRKKNQMLFMLFFRYTNVDVIKHNLLEKQAWWGGWGGGVHCGQSPCITTGTSSEEPVKIFPPVLIEGNGENCGRK